MEKLENLKLASKKEIDTSMAREYIKEINENIEWPKDGECYYEHNNYKILHKVSIEHIHRELISIKDTVDVSVGNNLAKKIEDNTEMFVQLEYLTRGTDAKDVRDGHIKLMSQLIRCSSTLWNVFDYGVCLLHFDESTPLYNLAFVAKSLYHGEEYHDNRIIIIDDKKMRPLCRFFARLCHEVGLKITIIYTTPTEIQSIQTRTSFYALVRFKTGCKKLGEDVGCTGVIAERSDLDSAIDVFISSSLTAPWRLKQIYVQESIFEDFKDALTAKSRDQGDGSNITVGDKTFLIESLRSEQGIPVHAYRTTKEVISLINTPFLSVWAAETALSHEISLRSPSFTVWVNDYGSFDGPPRSALSVFDLSNEYERCFPKFKDSVVSNWAKLEFVKRLDAIIAAVSASKCGIGEKCLPDLTLNRRFDDFIEVTDKTVCFGVQKQLGVVVIQDVSSTFEWLILLKALLIGNAVVAIYANTNFVEELQKHEIPILVPDYKSTKKLLSPLIFERLKVIRTNYGTIFAN